MPQSPKYYCYSRNINLKFNELGPNLKLRWVRNKIHQLNTADWSNFALAGNKPIIDLLLNTLDSMMNSFNQDV